MNVLIVGLGLIGGSIARDLRRTGFSTALYGYDSSKKNSHKALQINIVDKIYNLEDGLKNSDVVIVAIPVDNELSVISYILDNINSNTTVIDMGSTKSILAKSINQHVNRRNFISAHPMAGTENSGPEASLENLFLDKIAIICDQELSGPQHLALAEKMFHTIGMNIAYMSSEEQDHSTAFVSHLPHIAAFALANAVQAKEEGDVIFDLASGGFRSTVRLAKSSNEMWNPIFQQNKKYVVEALDFYITHLHEYREAIANNEIDKVKTKIKHANHIRSVLDGKTTQFIKNEQKNIKFYTKQTNKK